MMLRGAQRDIKPKIIGHMSSGQRVMIMSENDAPLKRLGVYFSEQQADLADFRIAFQLKILRGEQFFDELQDTLLKARNLTGLTGLETAAAAGPQDDRSPRQYLPPKAPQVLARLAEIHSNQTRFRGAGRASRLETTQPMAPAVAQLASLAAKQ